MASCIFHDFDVTFVDYGQAAGIPQVYKVLVGDFVVWSQGYEEDNGHSNCGNGGDKTEKRQSCDDRSHVIAGF